MQKHVKDDKEFIPRAWEGRPAWLYQSPGFSFNKHLFFMEALDE